MIMHKKDESQPESVSVACKLENHKSSIKCGYIPVETAV